MTEADKELVEQLDQLAIKEFGKRNKNSKIQELTGVNWRSITGDKSSPMFCKLVAVANYFNLTITTKKKKK